MRDKILYFLNPKSNEGQGAQSWRNIQREFPLLPKTPTDITSIPNLVQYIKSKHPDVIAIAGGDGTVNSVCSAVVALDYKPKLAIIPIGFGNALSYCFGVETVAKAIDVLQKQPHEVAIDLLKTNIEEYPWAAFIISAGFDARIVHSRMNDRYIGMRSYIISTLKNIFMHVQKDLRVTIDDKVTLYSKASSLVIANCPIIGRNYVVAPNARLNDGLLDCTLFSTKYAYLTNLRFKGFRHPLYSKIGKVHFKAKKITVQGEPFVEVDGDPAIHSKELVVEVKRNQVVFLRNVPDQIDQLYLSFTQ